MALKTNITRGGKRTFIKYMGAGRRVPGNKMFSEKFAVTGSLESGLMLMVLTFSTERGNTIYLEGKELTSGN